MTNKIDENIIQEVLRIRLSQMIINECSKNKQFKCPIHMAIGHEAIAVAVAASMKDKDWLLLTHRNIHYNLARSRFLKKKIDEYLCKETGEAGGQLGCMNLYNEAAGVLYTSSILGNQMAVAAGVGLGNRVKKNDGVVFVTIGDGALEEGIFYESLMMMKTYRSSALVIVENNGWSLASQIHERRCNINLDLFASSLDIPYYHFKGNDVYEYINLLRPMRSKSLSDETPVIVEVTLRTLGDWVMTTKEHPAGKYINYHAGAAPTIALNGSPVIEESDFDPVYVLKRYVESDIFEGWAQKVLADLQKEIA